MNLPASERNSYFLMILLGVVLGLLLYFGYTNYSDDIGSLLSGKKGTENTDETEEYPYFATGDRDYYIGQDLEWGFQVFQPEVGEYKEEMGAHFMVVKYSPDANFVETDEEFETKVLLAATVEKEEEKEDKGITPNGITSSDELGYMLSSRVRFEETFDWDQVPDEYNPGSISIDELKEKFPVGSRIAMRVLTSYPDVEVRTEQYCDANTTVWMCHFVELLPHYFTPLKSFNVGKEMDDDFALTLYSVSENLSTEEDVLK
jgi:hypothetical protein